MPPAIITIVPAAAMIRYEACWSRISSRFVRSAKSEPFQIVSTRNKHDERVDDPALPGLAEEPRLREAEAAGQGEPPGRVAARPARSGFSGAGVAACG